MYPTLLFIHSHVRWLVLALMLFAILRAVLGYFRGRPFSKTDNAIRHWTATMSHIQLVLGMLLYFQSPVVKYFWEDPKMGFQIFDLGFFGLIHALLMLASIVVLTIGSALAKRRTSDQEKFKTMLIWFSIALLLILIAIPWPFSPLSSRPYIRTF